MIRTLLTFILFLGSFLTHAQETKPKFIMRVGVFTSLYLDSAYTKQEYRFDNKIPKFISKGLDFAIGSKIAIDSFSVSGDTLLVFSIFDIQSKKQKLSVLESQGKFDSLDLIIADVSGADFKWLAERSRDKKIPFVSVTHPNDGGITNCSTTVILNPTLQVHCASLHRFILNHDPLANLVFVTKKSNQEMRIKSYFDDLNKGTGNSKILNWAEVYVPDSLSATNLIPYLDSTRKNIIILGSIDEKMSLALADIAASETAYEFELIGLPNWGTIPALNEKKYTEIPFYYSTSFYKENNQIFKILEKRFGDMTNGKPTDYAYKAFESTLVFAGLLLKQGRNLLSGIENKDESLSTHYKIRPVYKQGSDLSYYENKHSYVLKKHQGTLKKIQ